MNAATAQSIPTKGVPPRWQADLALAFVALLWGSTFVVVKSALGEISTVYFLAIRFWAASLCMALLFIKPFRMAGARAVWSGLRGGAIAGIFLWSGYILQTYGLKYTSAGKSGFITGLYIVLVPLIGAAVYRKWPHISEIIGILIATAGMGLMLAPGVSNFDFNLRQFRLDQFNFGDLLTIACAVAFAGHLVVLGYYSRRERFEAVALGQILCAAVLSTVALPAEPPDDVAALYAAARVVVVRRSVRTGADEHIRHRNRVRHSDMGAAIHKRHTHRTYLRVGARVCAGDGGSFWRRAAYNRDGSRWGADSGGHPAGGIETLGTKRTSHEKRILKN